MWSGILAHALPSWSYLLSAISSQFAQDDADLPTEWLSALELVQIASDRLIWDLSRVEKSLEFWSERLRQDQHLRTMLFGQGPVSFAKDVTRIVSRRQSAHSPSDRIERRVRSCFMSRLALCLSSRLLPAVSPSQQFYQQFYLDLILVNLQLSVQCTM